MNLILSSIVSLLVFANPIVDAMFIPTEENLSGGSDKQLAGYRVPGEWEPQDSVLIMWWGEDIVEFEDKDNVSIQTAQTQIIEALTSENRGTSDNYKVYVNIGWGNITTRTQRAQASMKALGVDPEDPLIHFTSIPTGGAGDLTPLRYPRDFGAEVMISPLGGEEQAVVSTQFEYYNFFDPYMRSPASYPLHSQLAINNFHTTQAKLSKIDTISVPTRKVSEGGDREFNGRGIMMCVEDTEVGSRYLGQSWPECLREQGGNLTHASMLWSRAKLQVENEFKRIFNLKHVIWLPRATAEDTNFMKPGDNIEWVWPMQDVDFSQSSVIPKDWAIPGNANGHVDEMARFTNETNIVLAEVSAEEASNNTIASLSRKILEAARSAILEYSAENELQLTVTRIPTPSLFTIPFDMNEESALGQLWRELHIMFNGRYIDHARTPIPTQYQALPALSYANYLVSNNVVIGQSYGDLPAHIVGGEAMKADLQRKDAEAELVLQDLFPGRAVVMVSSLAINMGGGGIHCNTRNMPALQ